MEKKRNQNSVFILLLTQLYKLTHKKFLNYNYENYNFCLSLKSKSKHIFYKVEISSELVSKLISNMCSLPLITRIFQTVYSVVNLLYEKWVIKTCEVLLLSLLTGCSKIWSWSSINKNSSILCKKDALTRLHTDLHIK
jgi:hypothetical protein